MNLKILLEGIIDITDVSKKHLTKDIHNITTHSDEVTSGSLFIALRGKRSDGHNYVDKALENGATFVIGEVDLPNNLPYLKVVDISSKVPILAAKLYDYPFNSLKMIGVTGTDGKTTTSTIIRQLLSYYLPTGYIGTNGILGVNVYEGKNHYTTPQATKLQEILSLMKQGGVKSVSMEVSSHALVQGRVDELLFDVAIFTNLSHEHLDYHNTIDEYLEAKSLLFKKLKSGGVAVVNSDDKFFPHIRKKIKDKIITYGQKPTADFRAFNIKFHSNFMTFDLKVYNQSYKNLKIPMLGVFNVFNVLAGLATMEALGYNIDEVIKHLPTLKQVSGRMHKITDNPFKVFVDYAHTPNGITLLLKNMKEICKGKIILVIGSAGERDKEKRKDMGLISTSLADYVVFTDEDPRSENPKDIVNDLLENVETDNYCIIHNRAEAIKYAFDLANENDCVIVSGKGAEETLEYNGYTIKHNDVEVCTQLAFKYKKG